MIALPPSFDANLAIDIVLLVMLLVVAGAIVRTRNLLAAIILFGIYSLVSAVWLVVMDAPDVAFTEAVVGAGISTIVLLGAILLTRGETEKADWRGLVAPAATAVPQAPVPARPVAAPSASTPATPASTSPRPT